MSEAVPYIDPRESLPRGGGESLPLMTTFADVHEVFTSKSFGQAGHDDSVDFIGDTLVTINGEAHKERLRMVRSLFTREALQYYEAAVLGPAAERGLASLPAGPDGWVHADLVPLGRKILTQIAAAVIGLDEVESPERTERLAYFAARLAQGSRLKFAVGDIDKLRQELLVDKADFVREFVDDSLRQRREVVDAHQRGELGEADLPRDLLTVLVLHESPEWDDDLINREVILYLVGSTLTTAMTVPHAVVHIENWVGEHPEDRDKLRDPEFLRQAAYESMRLHASSPLQIRRALEPTRLSNGMTLEEGVDVAVSAAAANRDAAVYGDAADAYDPYRHPSDPHIKLYGHTFAEGEHRCLGEHLAAGMKAARGKDNATQGMVLTILTQLYRRDVRLDPGHPPTKDPATTADFYVSCPVMFRPT